MRAYKKRCLLLLLLPLCLVTMAVYYFKIEHKENNEAEIHERISLLDKVFIGLLNVVEFLSTDMQDIIMDGLFGYRICQGSLIGALQDCSRENYNCPDELRMKIRAIIERLDELGEKALPYVQEKNTDYYNNYIEVLTVPFIIDYKHETLDLDIQPIPETSTPYNGDKGNTCFGRMMGTVIDSGRKSPPCTIVDDCWELMTVKGTIGYFTTHQLLYLLFGEHSGCVPTLEDRVRKDMAMSLREWQRHLCEQIYIDATIRQNNLQMDVESEDLFLEQIVLCGILGFQNFFNETWIQMVLTWQNPRGCFTAPDSVMEVMVALKNNIKEFNDLVEQTSGEGEVSIEKRKANDRLLHLELDNFRHMTQLSKIVQSMYNEFPAVLVSNFQINSLRDNCKPTFGPPCIMSGDQDTRGEFLGTERVKALLFSICDSNQARGFRTSRSLMTEAVMGNDCLAHKTGLGAAALASFVRYLVSELHGKN